MRRMTRLALLLLGMATAAGCASGRAQQIIEDRPALTVPPVPERSIEPQPAPPLPAVEPIPETSPVVTSSPKPRPTARNNESRPAEAKPDNQPEAAKAATPPPAPVEPLRSSSSPSGPEALKQIREIIQRTEGILSRVDYQKLGPDRRATYDGAKHWIQQCEEKIKQEDLTLALNFAKRAEEAAKSLETGR